jgi:hypothetical protein
MSFLRVIEVESQKHDNEKFILLNEYNDKCHIILNRIDNKETFEYLMDCLRDSTEVNKHKLFTEIKDDIQGKDE